MGQITDSVQDNKPRELKDAIKKDKKNIDEVGSFGWTPLHLAVFKGYTRCVEVLLAYGADVNKQAEDGRSAIFWAVDSNRLEEMKLIMKKDVDYTLITRDRKTIFDIAKGTFAKELEKQENKKKLGRFAKLMRD